MKAEVGAAGKDTYEWHQGALREQLTAAENHEDEPYRKSQGPEQGSGLHPEAVGQMHGDEGQTEWREAESGAG
ncbi:MAG: hypothetical protein M1401_12085 [Chloroflexi bacterium]|nr:hypothetical protein [Chloroflexota bacterium]